MKNHSWFKLAIAIAVCELSGIVGSLFTVSAVREWYPMLVRPSFAPPSWVFGPVWTTLFALMGIAAWLVWEKGAKRKNVRVALGIFIVQLVLNTTWSMLFFGLYTPGGALIEIGFLWVAIVASIVAFAKISKPAAWLLAPYILWVSFAAYLNYAFWVLNR